MKRYLDKFNYKLEESLIGSFVFYIFVSDVKLEYMTV